MKSLFSVVAIIASVLILAGVSAQAARDGRDWDQRFVGGHEAQSAGDVNGDGIDDLLMNNSDVAWVVFGSRQDRSVDLSRLGSRGFVISLPLKSYFWTAPLGDVNGDGLADVGLADPEAAVPDRDAPGVVYVIFGKADTKEVDVRDFDGADPRGYRILGAYDFTLTGYQGLEPAGDMNADGLDDVLVAAPFGSSTYVVYGQAATTDIDLREFEDDLDPAMCNLAVQQGCGPGFRIRTPNPDSSSSYAIGPGGDINGDGIPDVLITVWPSAGSGSIFVVFGKTDRLPVDVREEGAWGYRIRRGSGLTGLGAPTVAGDVNRDGKTDLILSCCWGYGQYPNGRYWQRRDRLYVIFGRDRTGEIELSDIRDEGFSITGPRRIDGGLGMPVKLDANGDRYPDLLIGASLNSFGQKYEGAVYVIYGTKKLRDVDTTTLGRRGYRIDGNERHLFFGEVVDAVADMDGDGRDELLVSTQGFDGAKRVFLYLSRS